MPRLLRLIPVSLMLASLSLFGCGLDEQADESGKTDTASSPQNDTTSSNHENTSDLWEEPHYDTSSDMNNWEGSQDTQPEPAEDTQSQPAEDALSDGAVDAIEDADTTEVETEAPVCDTTKEVVLYLSADDSNSMAAATIARGIISQGQIVYKGLRTYEFLNYYDFPYPAPEDPSRVNVGVAMRESEEEAGAYHLQIGVQAPRISVDERRPLNMILAIDSSSSMAWGREGSTGIDLARQSCTVIVRSLRAGDQLSIVAWGSAATDILTQYAVTSANDPAVLEACLSLTAYGTSDVHQGLQRAYELAEASFDPNAINRVVLISDGGANVGETDAAMIASLAEDDEGEAIYLLGVGVGDPWNYNDQLMDAVTEAGKGAYVFFDSNYEVERAFGESFLRHVELAARDVQVELTLPPSFEMHEFHGEEYSENPEEVDPQHLAANDAMVFHQIVRSCAPEFLTDDLEVQVVARYQHPITREAQEDAFTFTFGELRAEDSPLLRKGDAIVAFAEALKTIISLDGEAALAVLDEASEPLNQALAVLPEDPDLAEIAVLINAYRQPFEGAAAAYSTGGTGADPFAVDCSACNGEGTSMDDLRCAALLCDDDVYLSGEIHSPTGSNTQGTFAALSHFGSATNDLSPQGGDSYVLLATGPATGTHHSVDIGGEYLVDPFDRFSAGSFNAIEWRLRLKAPEEANGFRIRHLYFSQEYDEYVGTEFNDKFYITLQAGSTNSGEETVINYTACRNPEEYYDFVCSPGMQFCNPRQRYCYIAINTAVSECCWLNGCPDGLASTDISGTGFSCSPDQESDTEMSGSSTGWMITEWPIEPGEEFELVFHIHDTGDGIYDSEAIIDAIEFTSSVTPGTWSQVY